MKVELTKVGKKKHMMLFDDNVDEKELCDYNFPLYVKMEIKRHYFYIINDIIQDQLTIQKVNKILNRIINSIDDRLIQNIYKNTNRKIIICHMVFECASEGIELDPYDLENLLKQFDYNPSTGSYIVKNNNI